MIELTLEQRKAVATDALALASIKPEPAHARERRIRSRGVVASLAAAP